MSTQAHSLLPCPFCGGPADFEECAQGSSVAVTSCTWSVGCINDDIDCIGYQMLASFNRKCEAAEAWNKRAPNEAVTALEEMLADLDDPDMIDISNATISRARQALQKAKS